MNLKRLMSLLSGSLESIAQISEATRKVREETLKKQSTEMYESAVSHAVRLDL